VLTVDSLPFFFQAPSSSSSSYFTQTIGFASNLSRTIIREAQEDDSHSVASQNSTESSVSITDEELALFGPPWAKEGMLSRKLYWESAGKRSKNKTWSDVFAVVSKGELKMFTFGEGGGMGGSAVGGGNWLVSTFS
jgi:PH/SEC7 domain-containing protein